MCYKDVPLSFFIISQNYSPNGSKINTATWVWN